jgi:hypothetical protein
MEFGYAYQVSYVDDAGEDPEIVIVVVRLTRMDHLGYFAEAAVDTLSDGEIKHINSIVYLGEAAVCLTMASTLTAAPGRSGVTEDDLAQPQVNPDRYPGATQ